ncbi:MAG: glycosyltransferase, partial [Acidobacteriota bacterium]
MSTRVSILLPTYNRPDVLPLAINSILAQTFDDYELLVVGDGCAESTEQSIKGFRDSRIRWFDLPKAAGVGYANRNIALREARGEIIAYQSHDDLWLPDHLELLVRLMDNKKSEFAYSRPLDVSTGGVITPVSFNLHDPLTFENWVKRGIGYVPIAAVIHRRDGLAKYGYWNEDLQKGGDCELWARIIQSGAFHN